MVRDMRQCQIYSMPIAGSHFRLSIPFFLLSHSHCGDYIKRGCVCCMLNSVTRTH